MPQAENRRRDLAWLCAAFAAVTAVLVVYSQTLSLTWDEGFHLVAAELINAGRKPYVDFFFAQTPLNAYWVALWMRLAGQTWHTAHAVAALESAGAALLVADYVYRRLPLPEWRFTAAVSTIFLVGLNVVVVEFGTLGQAYGFCLLLTVAGFRLAVAAAGRGSLALCLAAGIASGAAAAGSLLTMTVAPVLLAWLLWRNRTGRRVATGILFCVGVVVAFIPMLRLFFEAPEQIIFSVFRYHLYFRQAQWDNWLPHDLDVLSAWLDCFHALMLGVLSAIGLYSIRRSTDQWQEELRFEFLLAGGIAVSMSLYLMTAHPTFPRYFLLTTPFFGIVAAAGLPVFAARVGISPGARWPAVAVASLMAVGLARAIYADNDDNWHNIETHRPQGRRGQPARRRDLRRSARLLPHRKAALARAGVEWGAQDRYAARASPSAARFTARRTGAPGEGRGVRHGGNLRFG